MNDIIIAIWPKGKCSLDDIRPRIIYCDWMTFNGTCFTFLISGRQKDETIKTVNVGHISVVGQYDKEGIKHKHHWEVMEELCREGN
jgi:hypothetical protein